MVSEKRFSIPRETENNKVIFSIFDNNNQIDLEDIVSLLNTQDQVIKKQETQIRKLQNQINKLPPKVREVWLE